MSLRLFPQSTPALADRGKGFSDRVYQWLSYFLQVYNDTRTDVDALQKIGTYVEKVVATGTVGNWVTNTPQNIASLLLPGGATWLVWGEGQFGGGAITGTNSLFQISKLSAAIESVVPLTTSTSAIAPYTYETGQVPTASANVQAALAPRVIASPLTSPLTINLVGRIVFSAGTPTAGAALRAVRIG